MKTAPMARLANRASARRMKFRANGCRDTICSRLVGRGNGIGRLSLPDPGKKVIGIIQDGATSLTLPVHPRDAVRGG
jgi:hypothetical protein